MCLISTQYTACGHAGDPIILDKDRCQQWPGPDCVFRFNLLPYDDLVVSPHDCDQCLAQSYKPPDSPEPDTCNNEARNQDNKEQYTDVDTASTPNFTRESSSLDSLDLLEAYMLSEAAAATFPPEKNSEALRVVNSTGKSDDGGTFHSFIASDFDDVVFQAPDIYNYANGELYFGTSTTHERGDREVEDLIAQVLSRWGVSEDSAKDA